jgi:molybdopterin synthase sulfur carrier subunit
MHDSTDGGSTIAPIIKGPETLGPEQVGDVGFPPLRSCTTGQSEVQVDETSVEEVPETFDHRYPSFRFRIITEQDQIRPHIRVFVNGEQTEQLGLSLRPDDQIYIVCALSGG